MHLCIYKKIYYNEKYINRNMMSMLVLKFVCKNVYCLIFIRTSGGSFEAVSVNLYLLYTSFHLERGCDVFRSRLDHRLFKRIHVLFVPRMKDRTWEQKKKSEQTIESFTYFYFVEKSKNNLR